MADISERWTCPNCNATWTRDTQQVVLWKALVHRVQKSHAKNCAWTEPTR